jgi:adenosylhomocysteine nucleosidase
VRRPRAQPIAVICALDWELAHLRGLLADGVTEDWHDGHRAHLGQLDEQPLVLAACGMGMVSAAAGTQYVISRYAPRAVLNYGCAGAHRADLLPGDVVVATDLVAYDNIRETPAGEAQYRGMTYLDSAEPRRIDTVPADRRLLQAAQRAAAAFVDAHEPWPVALGWPATVTHRPPRVAFGTVLSADRWNRSPATIARLVERHDSQCEDMEAAAIGLICLSEGMPFISIKDISNNELLLPTVDGRALLAEVGADQMARRAAAFTLAVVQAFGEGT